MGVVTKVPFKNFSAVFVIMSKKKKENNTHIKRLHMTKTTGSFSS